MFVFSTYYFVKTSFPSSCIVAFRVLVSVETEGIEGASVPQIFAKFYFYELKKK